MVNVKERIETPVEVHANVIDPVENDWQDFSMIPTLENHLDVILKQPGIYPTSEIVKLDP